MADPVPRPAASAREDELLEAVHLLGRELVRRGETLSGGWTEQTVEHLRAGELPGFFLPSDNGEPSLAFYSQRAHRAYCHVHTGPGASAGPRAAALLSTMIGSFPSELRRADVGLSGLTEEEEARLTERAVREFGGTVLLRRSMERPLRASDEPDPASPMPGARCQSVRSIPVDLLAQLDWRAFHGTPDQQLVADTIEEDRRGLTDLMEGRLGRFLGEASDALIDENDRLLGAVFVAEQSPRDAIVLDVVVDPEVRRRGVARYLLKRAFRALRALGFDSAHLWVTDSNTPARSLYDRLGFHPVTTARIYRWAATPPPHPHAAR